MTQLNLKPFTNVNHQRSNLNLNSPKFYVPSNSNLIRKPQSTNPNNEHIRPSTSYYIPRNLNNQVETNINPISSYSTHHTLYPNIIVKPPRTLYPKTKAENSVEPDNPSHSIDAFIDELVEGEEKVFLERDIFISKSKLLQLEYGSKCLPVIELFRIDGDPCKWPDFIQNFKTRVHDKCSFTDSIRMERLLSVLDGEVKCTVTSVGRSGIFYAAALKTLKQNFGNPQ